ncbi:ABC transporter permease subunit [Panacibacter ginsenosidivorans]|uniref:ABC transporter permease subunit n=1 Tax=Panacibacter ginsenosidivorans TaxID=1813871 RepID=A0A5B8VFJ0_9BACT|nr:ABC transporter permease subunit [Panacibacter ginsenosidivorans]QEC65770.1 ABC transporter permease subunit [Panacibacter ginsenosidivorans]QEC70079.1 ABC transporter permease subunit [Panacibacter ginsenosidivorans]
MKKIIKYVMLDILRSKIIIGYTLFLLAVSLSVFSLEDSSSKGLISLLNIILIIVPLVAIIFSTIYVYNSTEFIELLVSQPVKRRTLWLSIFIGLSFAFLLAFFIGAGIPILLYQPDATGITMLLTGMLLSVIFVSIALLASVKTRDKARGIGLSILLWFYFSIIFDGLVLFILFQFQDYPMEKPMLLFSALNPIDLTRILILLHMDMSALMGYTGAIFRNFFDSATGSVIALFILLLWAFLPLWFSVRNFSRKDL